MERLEKFTKEQVAVVNESVSMAEELVCNFYKLSASQWFRNRYDIKTLDDLVEHEIASGPFAQIIRYKGRRRETSLGSSSYDFYKICIQDHSVIRVLGEYSEVELLPFSLYIITHELIHIVRFSRFLVSFDASKSEKIAEEAFVHGKTHAILNSVQVPGLDSTFDFYKRWRQPLDDLG